MDPSGSLNNLFLATFTVADGLMIAGVILLIVFSAFFSASETAYTKANMLRLKGYADEKKK